MVAAEQSDDKDYCMSTMPGEFPPQTLEYREYVAERVLTAAAHECITAGIKHTTITDVARAADVPTEVIHQRWSTMGELLTAVVVRDLQARLDAMSATTGCSDGMDDHIADCFTTVVWFLDSHPLVGGAVRSDPDLIRPIAGVSVAPIVAAAVAAIVDHIAASALEHGARITDAEALTEVMTRLIQSLLLTRGESTPLITRNGVAGYARRCVVPVVYSLTTPTSG